MNYRLVLFRVKKVFIISAITALLVFPFDSFTESLKEIADNSPMPQEIKVEAKPAAAASTEVDYSQYDTTTSGYYQIQEIYDPFEPVNRKIDDFNRVVDRILIKPAATYYRDFVPSGARKGVSNFVDNMQMPGTFVNSVLQGDVENSFASFWSFVVNTSLGVGGALDIANEAGLKVKNKDVGQTLGKYGVGNGPYLILPFMGPSNTRDLVGRVGDGFLEPINYAENAVRFSYTGVKVINTRASLLSLTEDIESISFDPYATVRSAYTQRRNSEVSR